MADEINVTNEEVTQPTLPELVIEIDDISEEIDISEWCSNTKRILGNKYDVKFVFKTQNN